MTGKAPKMSVCWGGVWPWRDSGGGGVVRVRGGVLPMCVAMMQPVAAWHTWTQRDAYPHTGLDRIGVSSLPDTGLRSSWLPDPPERIISRRSARSFLEAVGSSLSMRTITSTSNHLLICSDLLFRTDRYG